MGFQTNSREGYQQKADKADSSERERVAYLGDVEREASDINDAIEDERKEGEGVIAKYELKMGKKVVLEKIRSGKESAVPVGTRVEGVLTADMKIGERIAIDKGSTKPIRKIFERNGKIVVYTETSTYEISTDESHENFLEMQKKLGEKLIERYELNTGKKIGLRKLNKIEGSAMLEGPVKNIGVLTADVRIGDSISLDNDSTRPLLSLEEYNGNLWARTEDALYEISIGESAQVGQSSQESSKEEDKKRLAEIREKFATESVE